MLEPVQSIEKLQAAVAGARAAGRRVGFVPTMGALHEGHTRLIERCRDEAGMVVVSIFVNPTQFGPDEDLSRYPRTLDEDLRKCAGAGATSSSCRPRRSSIRVGDPRPTLRFRGFPTFSRARAGRTIFAVLPRLFCPSSRSFVRTWRFSAKKITSSNC